MRPVGDTMPASSLGAREDIAFFVMVTGPSTADSSRSNTSLTFGSVAEEAALIKQAAAKF